MKGRTVFEVKINTNDCNFFDVKYKALSKGSRGDVSQ